MIKSASLFHKNVLYLSSEGVIEACMSGVEKQVPSPRRVVDTILDCEFQNLCMGIQELMEAQHINYIPQPPLPRCEDQANWSSSAFSPFISNYVSSLPVHGYVSSLCEKMNRLIRSPSASLEPVAAVSPAPTPLPSAPPPPAMPAPAQPILQSPPTPQHTKKSSPVPKSQSKPQAPAPTPKQPLASDKRRFGTVKEVHLPSVGKSADPKGTNVLEITTCSPSTGSASHPPVPSIPEIALDTTPAGTSSAVSCDIMGQIQPDVLCTLMEIMQKNAVRFFIQKGDEESELCAEIKV